MHTHNFLSSFMLQCTNIPRIQKRLTPMDTSVMGAADSSSVRCFVHDKRSRVQVVFPGNQQRSHTRSCDRVDTRLREADKSRV